LERLSARRPLPALVFLLGLSLLTALVWWRVIHRSDSSSSSSASSSCAPASNTAVPQPAAVTVNVLNSTDRAHLARSVAGSLRKIGFHVTGYGNDDPGIVVNGVAEIRYGPKGNDAATLLSFYLPGATLVATQRSDSGVVVSLGTKFHSVSTTAQARKAMQSRHVTQQPARAGPLARTPTASTSAAC
jgi:LytR cell envelope-related transcriptional attenuator